MPCTALRRFREKKEGAEIKYQRGRRFLAGGIKSVFFKCYPDPKIRLLYPCMRCFLCDTEPLFFAGSVPESAYTKRKGKDQKVNL